MRKTASYKMLRNSLLLGPLIYVVALLTLYVFQRDLLYFPSPTYISLQAAHAPAAMKELSARTEDGLDLKAWYAPATSKPLTIVFFHGNGDSLRTAAFIAPPYWRQDTVFCWSNIAAIAACRAVRRKQGFTRELHARGLILLAPYMSIAKQAQMTFPFFPAEFLVKDRYESFKKMSDLHIPVLMANGGRDEVIPPSQGRQLFALANQPKQFAFIPEAGHTDLFQSEFVDLSLHWLARLVAKTGTN
jgi:uncharacterized protein